MFDAIVNRGAFWSLLAQRVVYALNWYNVASIFSLMAVEFGQGVSGLGALTSSFYLGAGLFQIPGGVVAARFGPRLTAIFGTLLMSVAVLISATALQFDVVVLARFFVGAGMAFVFAPGIVLITQYFRRGAEGLGVGLYISAYQAGGMVGLFGWVVVATTIGWRLSLIASGMLGVFTAVALFVLVPREDTTTRPRVGVPELRRVLLDRHLLLLGVVATGLSMGSILVSSFVVYYLIKALGVVPALAGAVGSLVFLVPIFSSPIGGRLYDRRKNFKTTVALAGVVSALATVMAGFGGIYGPVISALLGGFVSGLGFTIVMSAARESRAMGPEYRTLSVAWVNSISLTSSFVPPIFFSFLAEILGYSAAWIGGGVLAFLLIIPIVLLREPSST